ncbi:MAG: glycosyltransferase family 4 protein [Candidatus Poribacteria bacterium]|nr:glycosyltransferase family 4 protein [Candidatus Poribacteria bacterium]
MLKVAHILPWANYGGTERSVKNLCQFSQKTDPFVLVLSDGEMIQEFRKIEIPIFLTPAVDYEIIDEERALSLLMNADLINLHILSFRNKESLYQLLKDTRKPFVITLRYFNKLPVLDCPIICVASAVRELQEPANDCTTILNGVDLSAFAYRRKQNKDKVILTRVCRPSRCAEYFWPVLERVLETFQNAELWIVGEDGTSTDRIKFLGVRRASEIPDILAQTDIFVYTPHPQRGAMDNCVLETMAMGTACVLSDVECVRDAVTHLKEGLLVPYGDQRALEKAIGSLIRDKSLRRILSQNALRTARERFDVVNVAKRYEEFYFSFLARSHEKISF